MTKMRNPGFYFVTGVSGLVLFCVVGGLAYAIKSDALICLSVLFAGLTLTSFPLCFLSYVQRDLNKGE